ncbi:MAG: hypothetical protein FWC42_03125 [Proteobacteria bacterium]|nr:hypothetical protein [Pseudomonadota bacterium]
MHLLRAIQLRPLSMFFMRLLLVLIGCCLVLLTGCASVERESRKAEAYANSLLPEPFEILDAKPTYALGDPMRLVVYLRNRRDPALQWTMYWQTDKPNGGNTQESVLRQYQQAQAYLRASQKLYDILRASPDLPSVQVRVLIQGTSSDRTGSPMIFVYGDLTNDNRMSIMSALYHGIVRWRKEFVSDAASTTLLGTPTADNFSLDIYFFPPPGPTDGSRFINLGIRPPNSPEFKSARYSINTPWDGIGAQKGIRTPDDLSQRLYPYPWFPDQKLWEADVVAAATSYVNQHPELGLAADKRPMASPKLLPDDLDVMRYVLLLCPSSGCLGQVGKKILLFNYKISERHAFDFKVIDFEEYKACLRSQSFSHCIE